MSLRLRSVTEVETLVVERSRNVIDYQLNVTSTSLSDRVFKTSPTHMKIVIVSCVAPPEPVVAGRVNWDIAEMLSDYGHDVTIITPHPSRPLGKHDSGRKNLEIINVKDNLQHVRLNSFVYPKYNIFLRSYESWDFGYKAIKYINANLNDADLIYATPWPFLGQYAFVKFNKSIPIIMNVQDLYPESLFAKIKSSWLTGLLSPLYRIDKYIANHSSHITVVSDNLKEVYLKGRGVNGDKITVIENWQDEVEFVGSLEERAILINKYGLEKVEGRFVFMYLGNIGPVAGLEKVIEEFGLLDSSKYVLVIAGSGSFKETCILLVDKLNLSNILFTSVPAGLKSVVELQSIADVLLLPISPMAAGSSVPSKLIAYLFSAKPVISSAEVGSDTGRVILESKCGWLVDDLQPWHVVMEKAAGNSKEELQVIGGMGYEYGMGRFSKSEGLKKVKELIERII
jgi:glycosyltransferase involved in cell wall biosynthesis